MVWNNVSLFPVPHSSLVHVPCIMFDCSRWRRTFSCMLALQLALANRMLMHLYCKGRVRRPLLSGLSHCLSASAALSPSSAQAVHSAWGSLCLFLVTIMKHPRLGFLTKDFYLAHSLLQAQRSRLMVALLLAES